MRTIFTRETLKHSIKPIVFILLVCAFIYFWGENRKVSVDMTFRPQISTASELTQMDLTFYNGDEVEVLVSQPLNSGRLAVQRLSLHPGQYEVRGIITDADHKTHFVQQIVHIPEDDATIDIYLRNK